MTYTQNNYQFNYREYKKKTTHKNGLAFSILIILIILLTGFVIFINPTTSSNYEFYFVVANSFPTYSQANTLSQEIQNSGGAGYVHLDKKYYVLINFYQYETDANNVIKNLKDTYPNVDIYTISAKKFKNIQNFNKKQNKSIENLSNFIKNTINQLSDLSIQYDKKELNSNQLLTKFTSIESEYNTLFNDVLKQFKTDSKFNVSREYLHNIKTDLQSLVSHNQENFSSQFKFHVIDIVLNYCSFLDSFWFFFVFVSNQFHQLPDCKTN